MVTEALNPGIDEHELLTIEEFTEEIFGGADEDVECLRRKWNEHLPDARIYHFRFNTPHPILGVFLGVNEVAVNDMPRVPPHIKMFVAFHEARHGRQHQRDIFMDGYYHSVRLGNKDFFSRVYKRLEQDANNFAAKMMRSCHMLRDFEEDMLRKNELGSGEIYKMMRDDIEMYEPEDFIDLLKKQIL